MNNKSPMKKILCFGDSNTWGYSPHDGRRYNRTERWPTLLNQLLPSDCEVIEQGVPGRTTFFEDVSQGFICGNVDLLLSIEKYRPDFIVLMLGTNDLKASFAQSAEAISRNVARLVASTNTQITSAFLLVAPPPIFEVGNFGPLFLGGGEKSEKFSECYSLRADELGCDFFDAGSVVSSSLVDGIHWEVEQHRNMAKGIAIKLNNILSV